MSFVGVEGEYAIDFRPIDEWDGWIYVTIGDVEMQWSVMHADE